MRIGGLANNLRTLGDNITEAEVVQKLLQVVPEHLQQIAISIETLLDVNELSLEEVTGRLRSVEQRKQCKTAAASSRVDANGRLLFTEEEWLAKFRKAASLQDAAHSSSGNGDRRGRGRGKKDDGAPKEAQPKPANPGGRNPGNCKNCGKRGHWAKDCRSKPKAQQAYVAQEEDEEPALLLAKVQLDPPRPRVAAPTNVVSPPSAPRAPSPIGELAVVEAKVFAQLDDGGEHDPAMWILDTGATNHMTGSRSAFAELDTAVTGTVRFGDGSVVRIEGRVTVLFSCRFGEHRGIAGVYYIPRLTANIVSLGQLDRSGSKVLIHHGILHVWDPRGHLLVRVRRSDDCLYTIKLDIDRPLEPFTVEQVVTTTIGTAPASSPTPPSPPSPAPSAPTTPAPPSPPSPEAVEFVTPPTQDSILDADADDDVVPRYRLVDNLLGNASPPGHAPRVLEQLELHVVSADEPASLAEAEADPSWRGAMQDELNAIVDNDTWSLTDLPHGHRAIGLKWVYKLKRDEQGAIVRYKARLVAKGYVQRQGVDFDEVFALVARLESVRLLLAVAAHQGSSEHGVYTRTRGGRRLMVGVYVDDLIITGDHDDEIRSFKGEMMKLFKMSDLGALRYYLGIEVTQDSDGITLGQAAYAGKILEKAGLKDCNPCQTPMEVRLKLRKGSDFPLVDATLYRSLVGSLRYLVNTRPDLAFSVGYVSRFMESPREDHLAAVRRILRYVAGTRCWGIRFGPGARCALPMLVGYSDSDLAGDPDERKSTSGQIFFINGGPVTWQSSKQKVVALSSCEAEYIAAAAATCQGVWLARLLAEVLGDEITAPLLKVDNQSTISLIKNPVHHDRSKHIDVKYHYIRECAEKKLIEMMFVGTAEQLGDIFTKSLGRTRFQELRSKIGVCSLDKSSQT
ncbi:Os04g0196500 [Oryza sativa Japonica Group]|uniref:Os04g0196500 protein n=1 Tax=Oryza sativa subsp. japonica TaxID=39947 RepID=C7J163_ORYSJ|nr:Os04g0196500 [Oryza sativa Japonica Group]|eukprot:NP_001173782.1 Os04g0196500 [Oryza sativa Japonica Group]